MHQEEEAKGPRYGNEEVRWLDKKRDADAAPGAGLRRSHQQVVAEARRAVEPVLRAAQQHGVGEHDGLDALEQGWGRERLLGGGGSDAQAGGAAGIADGCCEGAALPRDEHRPGHSRRLSQARGARPRP